MRKFVMTSLGVGLAAAFLLAAEPSKQTGEQELRMLVPKIVASWESMDTAKIEPYYATDADLTYFDLVPMKYNNWAEYRVGVKKAHFDPNRSIKRNMNDDLRRHSRRAVA